MMTLKDALEYGRSEIAGSSETPYLDSQLILCHLIDKDKTYLFLHSDDQLDEEVWNVFCEYIKRRKRYEPVQYIINSQEFMGLEFYVDKDVLIPRPDTEILIEEILKIANKDSKILDIGTGSGAITISLAKMIKNSFVDSVDISDKAIDVAKRNAESLGVCDRVNFINRSIFDDDILSLLGMYDMVVSNPPYIPKEEMQELKSNVVDYEPYNALYGGDDGLVFYRHIVEISDKILKDKGIIAFECGYNQAKEIEGIMTEKGCFEGIKIVKDLSGLDRVVIGTMVK